MIRVAGGLRLVNCAGAGGKYTNAQIDDYAGLPRRRFRWRPPVTMTLRARFSVGGEQLAGTAGFGFWNDPFLMTGWRTPAPPRALWFFFAAPPSNMALAQDVPGYGWKAATIDALSPAVMVAGPLAAALWLLRRPKLRRRLWPRLQRAFGVDEAIVPAPMELWHTYVIEWQTDLVRFVVDGESVLETARSPRGSLGFVLWIDNQWLAITPDGAFGAGVTSLAQRQWLEIADLEIRHDTAYSR
ncbi:MAG: family 16 glycosylhydrolase [Anaerolineales bacterium]|nr:family 16 glycosylhydrolase [Anaerolineales bacterium]